MRKMKKVLSAILVATMVMSMGLVSYADEVSRDHYAEKLDKPASFEKVYDLINTGNGEKSPAETFTFTFSPVKVEEAEVGVSKANMPSIDDVTVSFDALTEDSDKTVDVSLDASDFPGIGIYTYEVSEKSGTYAGVTYNTDKLYLVVTILRDTDDAIKYVGAIHYQTLDGTKTGSITNKYEAGSLEVSKEVTGNMGEKDRDFTVTVTFTAPAGKTVKEDITYNEPVIEKDAGGEDVVTATSQKIEADWTGTKSVTITLKHGEAVEFTNIPYGVTYTVEETDYTAEADGGYDEAVYTWSDEDNKEINTAKDTVKITNNKGAFVDTGISLDNMPYIMVLALVALGLVGFVSKKRSMEF